MRAKSAFVVAAYRHAEQRRDRFPTTKFRHDDTNTTRNQRQQASEETIRNE
jgi:hypothetical protein